MYFSKNFIEWSEQKSEINTRKNVIYFREREIWFFACGVNIGFEQDGKGKEFTRPVLILKKFNEYNFWGIPLTTSPKKSKYHFHFKYTEQISSNAILSQLRLYDSRRLIKRDGIIKKSDFIQIQTKIRELLTP
jgi:mRNA interferase MazF